MLSWNGNYVKFHRQRRSQWVVSNMLDKRTVWEAIWLNSKNYGELLMTVARLAEAEEYYAAMLILFNAEELIIKAAIDDYSHNLVQDLKALLESEAIGEVEYYFLNNDDCGMRYIRNIISHKEMYDYYLVKICNGQELFCQFSEKDTWEDIYNLYSDIIFNILLHVTPSYIKANQSDIDAAIIEVMPEAGKIY